MYRLFIFFTRGIGLRSMDETALVILCVLCVEGSPFASQFDFDCIFAIRSQDYLRSVDVNLIKRIHFRFQFVRCKQKHIAKTNSAKLYVFNLALLIQAVIDLPYFWCMQCDSFACEQAISLRISLSMGRYLRRTSELDYQLKKQYKI